MAVSSTCCTPCQPFTDAMGIANACCRARADARARSGCSACSGRPCMRSERPRASLTSVPAHDRRSNPAAAPHTPSSARRGARASTRATHESARRMDRARPRARARPPREGGPAGSARPTARAPSRRAPTKKPHTPTSSRCAGSTHHAFILTWKILPWAAATGGCNPASCVGCAPRRAFERRAAAASRQVALAAAEFARLWVLGWTLVLGLLLSSAGSAPPKRDAEAGADADVDVGTGCRRGARRDHPPGVGCASHRA